MLKYIVITTCLTPVRPLLVENEPCQAFSLSISCHPSFHNNEIPHQVYVHHEAVTLTISSLDMLLSMVDNPIKPPTVMYENWISIPYVSKNPFFASPPTHLKKSKALTHTMTTNPWPRHSVLKICCSSWSITPQSHQHLPLQPSIHPIDDPLEPWLLINIL